MLKKNDDGFTMLEFVVAMGLMAILWGIAYAMFYQSKNVFTLSVNKLQMCQDARSAIDGISRDLKGAMLKDRTDFFRSFTIAEITGLSPTPKNNSSILTFLSLTSNGSSTPITLVTYYLNDADELMRAEYNDTSYIYGRVSSFNPGSSTFYKLAANTAYFNLAYGTGSTWMNTWDSTDTNTPTTYGRLPDAVRVTLQVYGTVTGHILERGTYTTEVTLPYRVTH